MDSPLEELVGKMRKINQRLAGLQLQVQQPRLAVKADVKQYMKTHTRMKDGIADEKFGDISSARAVTIR